MKPTAITVGLLAIVLFAATNGVFGLAIDTIIDRSNSLGGQMLGRASTEISSGNLVIAPPGSVVVLGVLGLGSDGRTRTDFFKSIGLAARKVTDATRSLSLLHSVLNDVGSDTSLRSAMSIWTDSSVKIPESTIKFLTEYFDMDVFYGSLGTRDAGIKFQKWNLQKTDRSTRDSPSALQTNGVVVVDSLSFRGDWSVGFNAALTDERGFTLADGRTKRTRFMVGRSKYQYAETPTMQALIMPYGDGRFEMQLVVPRTWDWGDVPVSSLMEFPAPFEESMVTVVVPKFYIGAVRSNLRNMATGNFAWVGAPKADFSGLGAGFKVTDVVQSIGLDFDERGVKNSPPISDSMLPSAAIHVNRPFLFSIRDTISGMIVMMGIVTNPEIKEMKK